MEAQQQGGASTIGAAPPAGTLSWRLSSHPYTLLSFLFFRISSLLVYLFGILFTTNYVLIFIITMLFLSADFYNLKNIAGRRLVGLRWWNEVNSSTGATTMVFESLDPNDPAGRKINATDKRFFWLALYIQPVLWIVMAILSLAQGHFIWLTLVVIALVLTITNTVAFSRCDKFSQASNMASSAFYNGNLATSFASSMVSRMFSSNR